MLNQNFNYFCALLITNLFNMKKVFLSLAALALVASVYSCRETTEVKVDDTAETTTNDVEEAMDNTGDAIEEAAEDTGDAIENAAEETEEAVKDATDGQ